MNENKFIIAIVAATLFLLVGIVLLAGKMSSSAKVEANGAARAEVNSTTYDWGKIGINDGNAEAEFEIKNSGSEVLKLYNVTTSCACTTAQIITADQASPLFGMHTKSDYVAEVSPGKIARLKVIFDPLFHGPNGLGPITRTITVATNDQNNQNLTFNLSADVIK